ncbi:MAG: hypothetical protein IPL90_18115 [Holophagales bacterium]|nr:hypothetical protein [Holophagales bacterium]
MASLHSGSPESSPSLAAILVVTNLFETSSALWAVVIHHAEPRDRIRLAEALGFSLTAMVFLVVSTRTLRKGPTAS